MASQNILNLIFKAQFKS